MERNWQRSDLVSGLWKGARGAMGKKGTSGTGLPPAADTSQEDGGSAGVVGEEGPPTPRGRAGRAEGRPSPPVRLPPAGDPDPHLRFGGDARVVRGDAPPAPGAGHHRAGQQQHRVYAGRGLPRLQGGVLAPAPAPPAPAAVLGCAASEINRVQLSCGLSSFCRQEMRPHSGRHCCHGVVPSVGRDSLCGIPSSLQVRCALAPVSQVENPGLGRQCLPGQWSWLPTSALQPSTCARGSPGL